MLTWHATFHGRIFIMEFICKVSGLETFIIMFGNIWRNGHPKKRSSNGQDFKPHPKLYLVKVERVSVKVRNIEINLY